MKIQPPPEATKTVYPILRQIVNLIPPNIFHAAEASTKDLSRAFTPWSHAVALIYQQLTKTESLNGVCDAARVHASQWQMRQMVFFTNSLEWSAKTVAELYRARRAVELFFKELKQTCRLHDFVGYSENAVKWQIWTGLLVHLLLRFLKFLSKWQLSFSRLVGVVRAIIWVRRNVVRLLEMHGIAGGWKSDVPKPILPLPAPSNFA